MSSISFEILLILLLTVANGIFSGSEIAVVSAHKVRLEQLADQGNRKARAALKRQMLQMLFFQRCRLGSL